MNKPLIFGVAGKKRAGKDTFWALLNETLPKEEQFDRTAFADALKEEVADIFESRNIMTRQEFESLLDTDKEQLRPILQVWGTEVRRRFSGLNFWLEQVKPVRSTVVTDVRFLNEADRIKELGGIVVFVSRPEIEKNEDMHASEDVESLRAIADYIIVNDGDRDKYKAAIVKVYNQVKNEKTNDFNGLL